MPDCESAPFALSREDLHKIGRGIILALLGALVAWGYSDLMPALQSGGPVEWESLAMVLAAAASSAVLNTGRKFLADHRPSED